MCSDLKQSLQSIYNEKTDLATWLQCFSVYTAVLISKYPERATSLLLYQKNIAYLSQRFRWPSWVVYDNTFWSEAANNSKTDWSQIDYGVHSRSFHNQTLLRDSWCSNCHAVDHLRTDCPYAKTGDPPKKRPAAPYPTNPKRHNTDPNTAICVNFNRMTCRYGVRCNYRHACLRCQGPHRETMCKGQWVVPEPPTNYRDSNSRLLHLTPISFSYHVRWAQYKQQTCSVVRW